MVRSIFLRKARDGVNTKFFEIDNEYSFKLTDKISVFLNDKKVINYNSARAGSKEVKNKNIRKFGKSKIIKTLIELKLKVV